MSEIPLRDLRCDDCAFTAGTEANKCAATRLKTRLCVDAALPFYCHKREGLCAGWAEAANKADSQGRYVRLSNPQREMAMGCMDVLALGEERAARGEEITDASAIEDIMNVFGDAELAKRVVEETGQEYCERGGFEKPHAETQHKMVVCSISP